jgi:uncharacterized membrane-anchored protein YhcB (DUF1043 family)
MDFWTYATIVLGVGVAITFLLYRRSVRIRQERQREVQKNAATAREHFYRSLEQAPAPTLVHKSSTTWVEPEKKPGGA